MFSDFVSELTLIWNKPLSTHVMVPRYRKYLDMDGAAKVGLVIRPPIKTFYNHDVCGPPALSSKHCMFSASQLEKIYRAQAGTARVLSFVNLRQEMCQEELVKSSQVFIKHIQEGSPPPPCCIAGAGSRKRRLGSEAIPATHQTRLETWTPSHLPCIAHVTSLQCHHHSYLHNQCFLRLNCLLEHKLLHRSSLLMLISKYTTLMHLAL